MADVFVSYKQEEREAVQIIASTLNDLKVSVWFDTKLRSGGSFDEEIASALGEAKAVLVCWTPAAIQSEWVRGEATQGMQQNRLAACLLQPTELIPPFNLIHAENLSAWAGQPDEPAWTKLLERIGELIGRPGLASYSAVMRPGAPLQELKAWAEANGADPLVDAVWQRIALLEGEGASRRLAREKAEARASAERRKAQAEKSRRLARERGLRDPTAERRRFLMLTAAVAVAVVISLGAVAYFVDAQPRERALQDASTMPDVRAFLQRSSWHPVFSARAREKLAVVDATAWSRAQTEGTTEALRSYLEVARPAPSGAFIAEAEAELASAEQTRRVQEILSRILIYDGPIDGARDEDTVAAIKLFRYRWGLPVSGEVDETLFEQLDQALEVWIRPHPDNLRALTLEPPTEAALVNLAGDFNIDAAALSAIAEVEGPSSAFLSDGRLVILFEPHIFSRRTNRRFDATHPAVSYRAWDSSRYPRTQEERWAQFAEAFALDPEQAWASASYGRFQMIGFHGASQDYGFETIGEFVRFLSQSELNQYVAVLRFCRTNGLIDEIQRHDWAGFARRYNGAGQADSYAQRLAAAYERHRARLADQNRTSVERGAESELGAEQ